MNRSMRLKALVLSVILVIPHIAAIADERIEKFANAFIGACVQIMPQIQRVEAIANALGWKKVEGDLATMLQSRDNAKMNKLWMVPKSDVPPYIIGTSRGSFRGKQMAICTITNPYAPAEPIVDAVVRILNLKSTLADDTQLGQRLRMWRININGSEGFISITDAGPMKEPGITLGVMSPE